MRNILTLILFCSVAALSCHPKKTSGTKKIIPAWAKLSQEQLSGALQDGVSPTIEVDLGDGVILRMVYIPAGKFEMGSSYKLIKELCDTNKTNWYKNEGPQHQVTIQEGYYICITEVSVDQFKRFVEATDYETEAEEGNGSFVYLNNNWIQKRDANWRNPYFAQDGSHPVVCVSWNDAQEFVKWLNVKVGLGKFKLPSEAEWEYACRVGTKTRFSFGESERKLHKYGNYADKNTDLSWSDKRHNDGYRRTSPCGQFKANRWGIYDMYGNVWEWCEDAWHANYNGGPADGKAWLASPQNDQRVLRGGSWGGPPSGCRSANRVVYTSDSCYFNFGFRLIMTVQK